MLWSTLGESVNPIGYHFLPFVFFLEFIFGDLHTFRSLTFLDRQ